MFALARDLHRLYPDVIEAGGLANALHAALGAHGSPLIARERRVNLGIACVRVEGEHRRCQAYALEDQRQFVFDLWADKGDRSIIVGALADSLTDVGMRVHKWLVTTCKAAEVVDGLERVFVRDDGIAYDARDEVEHAWRDRMEGIEMLACPALVREASKRKKLRILLPYGGLFFLGFSWCTRYPFTTEVPTASPSGDGRFTLMDQLRNVIGEGDAAWAADVIEAHVPPHVREAVSGTREALPLLSK